MPPSRKSIDEVRSFFDHRAAEYRAVSRWSEDSRVNQTSCDFLSHVEGAVALDVGAGTGGLLRQLGGFSRRIAFDLSPRMLEQIEDKGIETNVGDLHDLPFPDNFADLVVCRQVLHYCDLELALRNIWRVLKREAVLHVVQVVEIEGVPDEWDAEWSAFRGIETRQHMRKRVLVEALARTGFLQEREEYLTIKDSYDWKTFLTKNRVRPEDEEMFRSFFDRTPARVAELINLELTAGTISYDRCFGFWLLRRP